MVAFCLAFAFASSFVRCPNLCRFVMPSVVFLCDWIYLVIPFTPFHFSISFSSISNCYSSCCCCCCVYLCACLPAIRQKFPGRLFPESPAQFTSLFYLLVPLLLLATGWQMVLIWLMNVLIKQNRHLSSLSCHLTLAKNKNLTVQKETWSESTLLL